ncbi:MAG: NAD-dependent epimerase/dehydratase family protein, partial [Polyangiaceae bacterium]
MHKLNMGDYLRAPHMSAVSRSRTLASPLPAAPSAGTRASGKGGALTVAVTGAAGFLGANLIGSLEEDDRIGRIVAIDAAGVPSAGDKTRSYDVDLTQPAAEVRVAEIFAAERVDAVAHLAFLAEPTHATAWAHELESVGTMHVTVAAKQAQVHKLVVWSQTWLYGAHPSNPNFLTEKHPL